MIAKRPQSDGEGNSSPDPMKINVDDLVYTNVKHRGMASMALLELYRLHKAEGNPTKAKRIKRQQIRLFTFLNSEGVET